MDGSIELRVAGSGGAEATLALIRAEPGTFLMGSPPGETGRDDAEGPPTPVAMATAYWLGRTTVTQAMWTAVMPPGTDPSNFKGPDRPVERVTWDEAMAFARELSRRCSAQIPSGHEFTLPTEAQWEYACRAGTEGPYAGPLDEMAWYCANSGETSRPVALKRPNAWGFYDMHGNVWEWCLDLKGDMHARRGGSWKGVAGDCRSACRRWSLPTARGRGLGFRLALAPAP
jgi:formylglycine-generating enzyme required for sulfatase activity